MTFHISSSGGSGTLNSSGRFVITSSKRFSSILYLLLECSQRISQLRSCRGEPALTSPLGDSEYLGDFRVRVSLNVVHNQRRSISLGEFFYRAGDAFSEIGLRFRSRLDRMCLIERHFTCSSYFAPPRVGNYGDGNPVQPGRECSFAAELREPGEGAYERVLRKLPCFLRVTAQSIRERVDPWGVRVVQRTPGQPISRDDPGDELFFGHAGCFPPITVATMLTSFDTVILRIVRSVVAT